MEEKRKRWRPSLAAYRELQKELESQIEATHAAVADCDAWREKYRALAGKKESGISPSKWADQHKALAAKYEAVVVERDNYRLKCERLLNRGFWARLLNKGV